MINYKFAFYGFISFFRYGNRVLIFFKYYLVKGYKYWKQSTNTANIVLLPANQIADIFSC